MRDVADFLQIARGFGSDALMAFFFALFFLPLARKQLLAFYLMLLWCFLLAGNHENILENHANLDAGLLQSALGKEFFFGSALSAGILVLTCELFALALIVYFAVQRWCYPPRTTLALLMTACLLELLPASGDALDWQKFSVLEENTRDWTEAAIAPFRARVQQAAIQRFYTRDLTAERWAVAQGKPNILMIVIESLSEEHLLRGWTPFLQEFTEQNVHFRQFLAHNAVTVNGLYALLCGDYPYLYTFNWEYRLAQYHKPDSTCLPKRLHGQGYATAYLQANHLSYMNKAGLAKAFGFQDIKGAGQLSGGVRLKSWWGLGDGDFFGQALQHIAQLQEARKPWFVTLLNVGTHHPYDTLPEEFAGAGGPKQRAYRYMDASLREFVASLEDAGVLDNTLLIITTDESREVRAEQPGIRMVLPSNRGFLAMRLPARKQRRVVDGLFMQADMAVSLLDYIDAPAPGVIGRSLFREYSGFRPIIFANNLRRRVFALNQPGQIIACSASSWKCTLNEASSPDTPFFDATYASQPAEADAVKTMRALYEYSDVTHGWKE